MPPPITTRPTPLDTPLPPGPTDPILSESQWTTLLAVADTFIPSIQPTATTETTETSNTLTIGAENFDSALAKIETSDQALARAYLTEAVSSVPAFRESLHRKLGHYVHTDERKGLIFVLSALK